MRAIVEEAEAAQTYVFLQKRGWGQHRIFSPTGRGLLELSYYSDYSEHKLSPQ
ncbi:MAG: hypothetical protein HY743_09285 [Deltaproteobacteria bacterium]|nr:hypothetical protein [Deltaproteobacteria bacterium]